MAQKIAYQKILFAFVITVSLVALQWCGTRSDDETTAKTAQPRQEAVAVTKKNISGTFHLQSTYQVPSGAEPLDTTVTLKNDVITAVSGQNVALNEKSKKYQDAFIQGISGQIVGKNINDVNVTYVNGSSLTAQAFNKALHDLQK